MKKWGEGAEGGGRTGEMRERFGAMWRGGVAEDGHGWCGLGSRAQQYINAYRYVCMYVFIDF